MTIENRRTLYGLMMDENLLVEDISERLWFSVKTIQRELKRGELNGKYAPMKAQDEIDKWRRNNALSRIKLLQDNWYKEELENKLIPWISTPDSIAWRMKKDGKTFVCTKTIYNYIWLYDWWLKKKLTYQRRYKKHKSRQWKRPDGYRHISTRPQEAEERIELWHMEIDLVLSKGNKAWLMTLVDRKSKFSLIGHVESKHAESINKALILMVSETEIQKKLKTITSDNWREFFWLKHIENLLWFEQYFADPYSSYQRWTNEQHNWQIRKIFPKWTDFSLVAVETIKNLQDQINRKPRKSLWYLTPEEVFYGTTLPI